MSQSTENSEIRDSFSTVGSSQVPTVLGTASVAPERKSYWYPGKYVGLKDRRKSADLSKDSDKYLEEIDSCDAERNERYSLGQTSWNTYGNTNPSKDDRTSRNSMSTWLKSFSTSELNDLKAINKEAIDNENEESEDTGKEHYPNPNNLGKLTEDRTHVTNNGQKNDTTNLPLTQYTNNSKQGGGSPTSSTPPPQQQYSSWFRRRTSSTSAAGGSSVVDPQENTERINEAEESKKESVIAKTIRTIRNKFVDRKLQGRILIYRMSGVVATAVTCDILSTDQHSYPGE